MYPLRQRVDHQHRRPINNIKSQNRTMKGDWMQNIADALVTARMTGAPAALTPEVLARLDDEAGIRVQHLTLERLRARVAGWKVAVMPEGHVIAAPIIDRLLLHSPATLPRVVHGLGGIECEIAFLMAGRSRSGAGLYSIATRWPPASTAPVPLWKCCTAASQMA